MTTGGLELLDQRLDALDRALLGLVSRSERMELVAGVEKRFREKQETEPALLESLATSQAEAPLEALSAPAGAARGAAGGKRARSRLALSSGILGIVAVSLMLAFPITYVVIATIAEMIGEVPAIALIVLNVVAVAGTGALAGFLSVVAIVRLSRSKKKRGLGWAITGLCTSPLPALCGLLGLVCFVLPMAMEYASNASSSSAPPYVASVPVSQPMMIPAAECQDGVCPLPPSIAPSVYANAPAYNPGPAANLESVPLSPVNLSEGMTKPLPVTELKLETLKVETEKKAEPASNVAPMPDVKPMSETQPVLEAKPVAPVGGEEAEVTKPATALVPLSAADMEESLP